MNNNLTPSEIAEIEKTAEQLYPDSNNWIDNLVIKGSKTGYIAAACEYAAEIKRLREGIEEMPTLFAKWKDENYFTISMHDVNWYLLKQTRQSEKYISLGELYDTFKQLLNSQP